MPVSYCWTRNGFWANTYVQEQGDNESHCSADVCRDKGLSQTVHKDQEHIGLEIFRDDIDRTAGGACFGVVGISD